MSMYSMMYIVKPVKRRHLRDHQKCTCPDYRSRGVLLLEGCPRSMSFMCVYANLGPMSCLYRCPDIQVS